MTLRTLAQKEYIEWKHRMQEETNGTYILIYVGLIFSVFISCIYGFGIDRGDMDVAIRCALIIAAIYQMAAVYLSYVREGDVRTNIFEKYIYTPVDFKMLCKAKVIVTARIIGIPVLAGQMAAVLIRIVNFKNESAVLSDITLWMPVIIATVFVAIKCMEFNILCKKAWKK